MLCWGPHRHLAAVVWTEIFLLRKESLSLPAHGQAGLPGAAAGRGAFGQLVPLGRTDSPWSQGCSWDLWPRHFHCSGYCDAQGPAVKVVHRDHYQLKGKESEWKDQGSYRDL